jgi:glycosyltransferase involved in cell wall biosynthesis
MNISIISHGAHGGRGGIDQYIANLIDVLIYQRKIKSINLFTKKYVKLNNKKIKKFYSNNSINFLIIIILNIINIFKSKIIIISHINLIPYLIIPILLNKKVILLTYGLEIFGEKKNFIYKFIIKKINFFICMRNFTMKILKKKYNLQNKKFFLLPNCIKVKKFKILSKKKNKNVITVARLDSEEKYKGIDETLEAIALLKKINFYYFVVGDGNDKERLIQKTKNLKLTNNVIFLGKVSNNKRSKLFQNSSIISMPGSAKAHDTYPFRFVFLEAAEFGLKIIGSYPPIKSERNIEKKYINLNFVDPKNKKQILNTILKLQKQKTKLDKGYLNDYSFDIFKIKLNNILSKIY